MNIIEELLNGKLEEDCDKILRINIKGTSKTIKAMKYHLNELGKLHDELDSVTGVELLEGSMKSLAGTIMELEKELERTKEILNKNK